MQLAVIFVGAAPGNRIENGARRVAYGRIEAAGLDFEFRDGVLWKLERDQGIVAAVKEGVGNAIDRVLVGVKLVAIGCELR